MKNFDLTIKMVISLCLFLFFAGMLCSCSPKPDDSSRGVHPGLYTSAAWIKKLDILAGPVAMESTPVVWNNKLTLITWAPGNTEQNLVVWDMATMTELARIPTGLGFVSALVNNGTLYVFGTAMSGQNGYEVRMLSSSDLITWTPEVPIFEAGPGQTLYNTSVTADASGFILAYETCESGMTCFHVRFKHSTDLVTWNDIGGLFSGPGTGLTPDYYTGCPTIRFVNGYYYVFYLAEFEGGNNPVYATLLDRSADLMTWEESKQGVVFPDGPDQNRNTSDFDLVEFNGEVQMVYSKAAQESSSNVDGIGIRQATFNGTLEQFVERFF